MITFIIPTIGRPTLSRTITSLIQLDVSDWNAIVMFDGIEPTMTSTDPRITIMRMDKTGTHNHAGAVRNEAIRYATTEWIGFVDDDDVVTPDYLTHLNYHCTMYPFLDVIIFRMKDGSTIIPRPGCTDFTLNDVGISFCMKRSLCEEFPFEPCSVEDFLLLDTLRCSDKYIYLSNHVTYLVRP